MINNYSSFEDMIEACAQYTKSSSERFLAIAEQCKPELAGITVRPKCLANVVYDKDAYQNYRIEKAGEANQIYNKPISAGDRFILDFNQHCTGYLTIRFGLNDGPVDGPVRLKFIFAEVPLELGQPFDPYKGGLSRAWLQDEIITLDYFPVTYTLPRRYAFRYVLVEVLGTPGTKPVIADISAENLTSADAGNIRPLPDTVPEMLRKIDEISLETLKNCMQTVFEDGPKRDRRYWLGDFYLQALANYVSFRNMALAKRCLYLTAGLADEDGVVGATCLENPRPMAQKHRPIDYVSLFARVVLDYVNASGDIETGRNLWPVCLLQAYRVLEGVNKDWLYTKPDGWWNFIDWNEGLDKNTSTHGAIIFGLRGLLELAEVLGEEQGVQYFNNVIQNMRLAAKQHLWDTDKSLFISGDSRQVSWSSQVWMVLAEVVEGEESKVLMQRALKDSSAIRPIAPYAYHYVIDALIKVDMKEEAFSMIEQYWGDMVKKGADTFWEVYDPENDFASPYNDALMNSYCHAWSCSPTYFIRKYFIHG